VTGTLRSQPLTQRPREGAEAGGPRFEPAFISLAKERNSAVQRDFGIRTRGTRPGGGSAGSPPLPEDEEDAESEKKSPGAAAEIHPRDSFPRDIYRFL